MITQQHHHPCIQRRSVLSREAEVRPAPQIMPSCRVLERSASVAYLGPEGTFSQSAAIASFGETANAHPCPSIDDVFRVTAAGSVDYGVVPVENSTEGAVSGTLDLMLHTPLEICGEIQLRIHQNMLRKVSGLLGVRRVYSHAQSLAQCRTWLDRNLHEAERIPVASNAEAARMAAQDEDAAAIAGEAAAKIYGLTLLAHHIEDEQGNTTRFLIIGEHDANRTGNDKTSLVMSTKNHPGAMMLLLEPLARHQVNMTKLESRPSRSGLWEYVFFVDVEGHRTDKRVARALRELTDRASLLKVLGSYPTAAL